MNGNGPEDSQGIIKKRKERGGYNRVASERTLPFFYTEPHAGFGDKRRLHYLLGNLVTFGIVYSYANDPRGVPDRRLFQRLFSLVQKREYIDSQFMISKEIAQRLEREAYRNMPKEFLNKQLVVIHRPEEKWDVSDFSQMFKEEDKGLTEFRNSFKKAFGNLENLGDNADGYFILELMEDLYIKDRNLSRFLANSIDGIARQESGDFFKNKQEVYVFETPIKEDDAVPLNLFVQDLGVLVSQGYSVDSNIFNLLRHLDEHGVGGLPLDFVRNLTMRVMSKGIVEKKRGLKKSVPPTWLINNLNNIFSRHDVMFAARYVLNNGEYSGTFPKEIVAWKCNAIVGILFGLNGEVESSKESHFSYFKVDTTIPEEF